LRNLNGTQRNNMRERPLVATEMAFVPGGTAPYDQLTGGFK
jgi:hypothetical protein